MKKLINELKWFDRLDWGFFSFLVVMNIAMVALFVAAIMAGAVWLQVVLTGLMAVAGIIMLVHASKFAIDAQKSMGRHRR